MASRLSEGSTGWVGPARDKAVDRTGAVGAIRRLAGASSAEILVYDRLAETLDSIVASDGGLNLTAPALLDAVQAQTGLILSDPRPRWIAADERDRGQADALLLMKLSDRGSRTFFIALAFADASSVVRARLAKIAPDLATLIRFHVEAEVRLRDLEEVGAAATAALDHGACGVIAIRADRTIIYRNKLAAAYLDEGLGLQVRRGKVGAIEGKKFDAALLRVLDDSDGGRGGRPPASVMLLKQAGGARPAVIVVAPVPSRSPGTARETGAAALIYMLDPLREGLGGLETLCRLYGLSGVESRLLINLVGGLTLADAAAQMRIKIETARTYLKQIFAKTDTHRQTDLTSLMWRYLRAIRGDFDFQPI